MDNLFKKNKNKDVFKIFAISCSVLLLVVILNFYVDYKYLSIVNNFYSKFNSCDFTEAKKIINNDSIYLKLKKKKLYYIRVRAYSTINGKKVYGTFSSIRKIKTR